MQVLKQSLSLKLVQGQAMLTQASGSLYSWGFLPCQQGRQSVFTPRARVDVKPRPGHTLSRAVGHLWRLTTSEPVSHTARQMLKAMM